MTNKSPESFAEHKLFEHEDVTIFQSFPDDLYDVEPLSWYQTDGTVNDHPSRHDTPIVSSETPWELVQFNVNDLPLPDQTSKDDHEAIIRAAIDNEIIQPEDE